MRAEIVPGSRLGGEAKVPGDKSIAHRWLILAATAVGRSELRNMTSALDVRSTAECLDALDVSNVELGPETVVEGTGRRGLREPGGTLNCGNSGTTMRLLSGVLAAAPFRATLVGDESLMKRPMERVAEPLRQMGARIETADGYPPVNITGGDLTGITYRPDVPSAQVKGAVLLAGEAAAGETTVVESVKTRDHTERALGALGAPIRHENGSITISTFDHAGFEGTLPGDVSGAAFLIGAAALTGSSLRIADTGLNPSRTHFLDVLRRMEVRVDRHLLRETVGEPAGDLEIAETSGLKGVTVGPEEFPLLVDDIVMIAVMAAFADGESRVDGLGELRVKESDRLAGLVDGIRGLGGRASNEGDSLIVAGGGLKGGTADARGDHRLAMAFVIGALAAQGTSQVEGVEYAEITFPGFVESLARLGAKVEVR
ncbi:MAG: 3-phosphoshikimate 1-carboxyvinyltransferase [Actinomycetota bacterium]